MRAARRRSILLLAVGALLPAAAAQAAPTHHPGFVLTTTQPGGAGFAPAFVGNGYLAGRQPADGQGFGLVPVEGSDEPLRTQSEVHGPYALAPPVAPEGSPPQPPVERRAALPAWSTLATRGQRPLLALDGPRRRLPPVARRPHRHPHHRGDLDVARGPHRRAHLRGDARPGPPARRHRPADDRPAVRRHRHRHRPARRAGGEVVEAAGSGHEASTQWVRLSTVGLSMPATVASVLRPPAGVAVSAVPTTDALSAAQAATFPVQAGKRYRVLKAVGVAVGGDGGDSADPTAVALAAAREDEMLGDVGMRHASDAAWARLWQSDVQVLGDTRLRAQVRSALFSLWASVRDDLPWAPSPGGLSSDGYNGHVFWDSETWMYPTLLATAPAVAKQTLEYRFDRLAAAEAYAAATGWAGTRFPWESRLSGNEEETPAFADTGQLEVHISADIALAAWQYWLATGDRAWLESRGWQLLSGIATYWASRAVPNGDGSYSIRDVIPPDEYAEHVDDSVYTNVGARDALRLATQAAAILGHPAPPEWATVADHLRILFDAAQGIHPEYAGYPGNAVKQADVTLLAYPWENPQSDAVTQADLDYYVSRTDPGGPSMTDAVHSILSSSWAPLAVPRSASPAAASTRSCGRRTSSSRRPAPAARSPSRPAPAGSCRSSCTATPASAGAPTRCRWHPRCRRSCTGSRSTRCTGRAACCTS